MCACVFISVYLIQFVCTNICVLCKCIFGIFVQQEVSCVWIKKEIETFHGAIYMLQLYLLPDKKIQIFPTNQIRLHFLSLFITFSFIFVFFLWEGGAVFHFFFFNHQVFLILVYHFQELSYFEIPLLIFFSQYFSYYGNKKRKQNVKTFIFLIFVSY